MECLKNCSIIIDIEIIENISGANRYFEIVFLAKDKTKSKIIFDCVWDMRYSIENGCIDRFCQFRKCLTEGLIDNSIYIVENSEYIKYFGNQVSGTYPIDEIKDYIMVDAVDAVLEILTIKEPVLERLT